MKTLLTILIVYIVYRLAIRGVRPSRIRDISDL